MHERTHARVHTRWGRDRTDAPELGKVFWEPKKTKTKDGKKDYALACYQAATSTTAGADLSTKQFPTSVCPKNDPGEKPTDKDTTGKDTTGKDPTVKDPTATAKDPK